MEDGGEEEEEEGEEKEEEDAVAPRSGGSDSSSSSSSDGDPWVELTLIFPSSAPKVLMLGAAERAVVAAAVKSSNGISRALVSSTKKDGKEACSVAVVGSHLPTVWALEATLAGAAGSSSGSAGGLVDLRALYTNDIGGILTHYGVEAARGAIVRELAGVFGAYGINVDGRHLSLVADYMTQAGGFRPMNRAGIEAHGSPLLKMSFETTMHFLTAALLRGEEDNGNSPSARIALGRTVDIGSGVFDCWSDLRG